MGAISYVSAEQALQLVKPGHNLFIQTACAAPQQLITALVAQSHRLSNVNIYHLHTQGIAPYVSAEYKGIFNTHCFFIGSNTRKAVQEGNADYIPVFLSEISTLFNRKIIPLDVVLLHVSPPDEHGYCSLGVSVDVALAAAENASILIAQVNPNMPRTHGKGFIHVSRFNAMVWVEDPILEMAPEIPDAMELKIADYVSSLVEDGATLQMGIGRIPNAVLAKLIHHKKLGVHSEMFSDGIIDLVERGVITGEFKKEQPNKIVAGFVAGTRKLYDYIHDNPIFELHDASYVNDTAIIKRNPKVTAINSAVEIDLTGQICADSIGTKMHSGVGGQMDFIRAAALSEGGKPIIAMPSITKNQASKIVSTLKVGSGVVTTRSHVHYVVTEYGIADLFGKNIKQRVRSLIQISHPDHREALSKEAFELWKINA